jgi:hypothetical protein
MLSIGGPRTTLHAELEVAQTAARAFFKATPAAQRFAPDVRSAPSKQPADEMARRDCGRGPTPRNTPRPRIQSTIC